MYVKIKIVYRGLGTHSHPFFFFAKASVAMVTKTKDRDMANLIYSQLSNFSLVGKSKSKEFYHGN